MSDETPAAAPPPGNEAAPSVAPAPRAAVTATGRRGPAALPSRCRPTPDAPSVFRLPGPRTRRWTGAPSANETALYGALLADVTFLRRRGFGVHCEGDLFRVGNRLLDAQGVHEVAARERRLLIPLPPST